MEIVTVTSAASEVIEIARQKAVHAAPSILFIVVPLMFVLLLLRGDVLEGAPETCEGDCD